MVLTAPIAHFFRALGREEEFGSVTAAAAGATGGAFNLGSADDEFPALDDVGVFRGSRLNDVA